MLYGYVISFRQQYCNIKKLTFRAVLSNLPAKFPHYTVFQHNVLNSLVMKIQTLKIYCCTILVPDLGDMDIVEGVCVMWVC